MPEDDEGRYMKSYVGDQWYRVTEWEDVEGKPGRHIAKQKEPVEEEEVPDRILEAAESSTEGDSP